MNLYQFVNNEAVSSICSGEKNDLKIKESEWLRAFLDYISRPRFFPEIEFVHVQDKYHKFSL